MSSRPNPGLRSVSIRPLAKFNDDLTDGLGAAFSSMADYYNVEL